MNLFLTVLDPSCCLRAFSSCSRRGLLSRCVAGASHVAVASLAAALKLQSVGSVVVAHALSYSKICRIFLEWG